MKRVERTVHPNEVGTTLKLLDGYQGAHNRNINPDHVKYLAKNIETVRWLSEIVLLEDDGKYHVLDGSHTLLSAVRHGEPVHFMKVTIMEEADIKAIGVPLSTILHWLNRGKNYRKGDHLNTLKNSAKTWFSLAKEFRLDIGAIDSRQKITWTRLLQAKLWGDKSHAAGRLIRYIVNNKSFDAEKTAWVGSEDKDLRPFFEAVDLWEQNVAKPATAEGYYGVHSAAAQMFAYVVKLQNPTVALTKFFSRCGKNLNLRKFSDALRERDYRKALRIMLRAGNYRVKDALTAVGESGRD